jgi:hypothetical protein
LVRSPFEVSVRFVTGKAGVELQNEHDYCIGTRLGARGLPNRLVVGLQKDGGTAPVLGSHVPSVRLPVGGTPW